MRRLFAILSLCAVALLGSCSLFSVDEKDFGDQIYYSNIYGKWKNGTNWIEFTEAGYYYTYGYGDGSLKYGKFSKTDSKQFTLEGFGVMDVSEVSEVTSDEDDTAYYLNFDLTLDDESIYIGVKATKEDEMEVDDEDQLDKISATWYQTNIYRYNGGCGCDCVTGDPCGCEYDTTGICSCATATTSCDCNCLCKEDRVEIEYLFFSNTGFLVAINNLGEVIKNVTWKWNSEAAGTISYYDMTEPDSWADDRVEICSLTYSALILYYWDESGVKYVVEFDLKSSGDLD